MFGFMLGTIFGIIIGMVLNHAIEMAERNGQEVERLRRQINYLKREGGNEHYN